MSKIKTYPRGQRKEFAFRCLMRILNEEFKKFYQLRKDYDHYILGVKESDLISQLKFIHSLCTALLREVERKISYYELRKD